MCELTNQSRPGILEQVPFKRTGVKTEHFRQKRNMAQQDWTGQYEKTLVFLVHYFVDLPLSASTVSSLLRLVSTSSVRLDRFSLSSWQILSSSVSRTRSDCELPGLSTKVLRCFWLSHSVAFRDLS